MGWLMKDSGSLFGDNLHCRLCLVCEQQRENPGYSQQDLWHLSLLGRSNQPCCIVAIASQ